MPSVCKNSDKASVTEQEQCLTPYKACIMALDKKVRNLEKRKGKLDGYREKLDRGEKLDKDQKEAISKYESVMANLEFARELQKQIQSMSDEADRLAEKASKKQAKKEKIERQQQESDRLSDILMLQALMLSLGSDDVRADLSNGKHRGLTLKEETLTQLDEFYQLISPTTDNTSTSFTSQLGAASEHIISYLDRVDKPVVGTTYHELHEIVDNIAQAGFFETPGAVSAAVSTESAANQAHTVQDVDPTSDVGLKTVQSVECDTPHDEATSSESSGEMINMPSAEPVVESTYETMSMSDVAHALHRNDDSSSAPLPSLSWSQPAPPPVEAMSSGGGSHSQFQRPLQDIVSSLQGSYNFLQESEIDMEQSFECVGYNVPAQKHTYTFVNQQYAAQHGTAAPGNDLSQLVSATDAVAASGTHPNGGCVAVHHQQESGFVVVGHDTAVGEMQYSYSGNEKAFITPAPSNIVGPNQAMQSKAPIPPAGDSRSGKRVGGGDPQDNIMHSQAVPLQRNIAAAGRQGYGIGAGQGRYGMGPGSNRGGSSAARGGAARAGYSGQSQTSSREGKSQ